MNAEINKSSNFKIIFRTLQSKNYRLYFTGQSISLIGTWLQIIAMSWLVYSLTNSAFMLGLVGFLSRIPTLIFAPIAGVITDRVNKYRLLLLTQILSMLQAAVITILLFTGIIQIWHIIVLGIFLGIINSFDTPVRQSFVIEMIDKKEDLSNGHRFKFNYCQYCKTGRSRNGWNISCCCRRRVVLYDKFFKFYCDNRYFANDEKYHRTKK
jgi:Na+/melibiose symporter-like transporter